ncbi:hypothetical protein GCK72_024458 [Caenorhabditis remanei]|uniref:SET domain-containing protein n=1 Tax=Caenorhabditis remanei TaxID=31234 RepID=A0A6A5FZS6_CAERE|nr:hypothetical protein GCK72_024458 [Caenorhabditis remanei]KAF1747991.1 hypothetical protein GCK72_024458 [Caenorhabditis remanei]
MRSPPIRRREKSPPVRRRNSPEPDDEQPVEMTSVIPGSPDNDPSKWPPTAIFDYTAKNFVGRELSTTAQMSLKEGEKTKICCSCGPDEECSKNENCECNRVVAELQKIYYRKARGNFVAERCQALTDQGIKLVANMHDKQMFFNCGSECTCGPSCEMKVLMKSDKGQADKFFIQRRNENTGFSVFAKECIEKGTVLGCLNGEICGESLLNSDATVAAYSMSITHKKDMLRKFYNETKMLGRQQKQYLKTIFSDEKEIISINTLQYGNFTRFANHSCKPNSLVLRAFEGGLSISDIRLFFVTSRKIKAGEEITIHYGDEYKAQYLPTCFCEYCLSQRQQNAASTSNQPVPQVQQEMLPIEDEEQERAVDFQEPTEELAAVRINLQDQNTENEADIQNEASSGIQLDTNERHMNLAPMRLSIRVRNRRETMNLPPSIENNENQLVELSRRRKRSADTMDQDVETPSKMQKIKSAVYDTCSGLITCVQLPFTSIANLYAKFWSNQIPAVSTD